MGSSKRMASPGPMDYRARELPKGPCHNIAGKYDQNSAATQEPGPQSYNFNATQSLKVQPRATIGGARKVSCLVPRDKSPGP